MAIGRKGMFFTIMSLMLVVGFVFLVQTHPNATPVVKSEVFRTRIITMNSFVKDLGDIYVEAVIIRAAKDTMEQMANANVVYFDRNEFLNRRDGAFNNMQQHITNYIYDSQIAEKAQTAHFVNLSLVINVIDINQTEPWFIDVHTVITVNVTEIHPVTQEIHDEPTARWEKIIGSRDRPHVTKVPIEGMINPLTKEVIVKSVPLPFNQARQIDAHFNVSTQNLKAPSYLQRFYLRPAGSERGTFYTSDCCGIFSIVTDQNIIQYAPNVEELLNIDGSHRAWCVDDAQLDFTMFDSVRSPSREMFSGIRLNIGGTSPLDAVYGDARPYFVITGGDRDTACR